MYNEYEIMIIDDSVLPYRLRYTYYVMKFCGADSKQKPIYNVVKKFRTESAAIEYINKHKSVN